MNVIIDEIPRIKIVNTYHWLKIRLPILFIFLGVSRFFFNSKKIICIITSEACTLHKKVTGIVFFEVYKGSFASYTPSIILQTLFYLHIIRTIIFSENMKLNNYIIHRYKYCSRSFCILKRIIHSSYLMFSSISIKSEVLAVWNIV